MLPSTHNDQRAVSIGGRDSENTRRGAQPQLCDTLAAACAATGDFDRAMETEQKAIELAPDNTTFQKNLQLHQSKRTIGGLNPVAER